VLTAISGVTGRGKSGLSDERLAEFEDAIARLEADGGVQVCQRKFSNLAAPSTESKHVSSLNAFWRGQAPIAGSPA